MNTDDIRQPLREMKNAWVAFHHHHHFGGPGGSYEDTGRFWTAYHAINRVLAEYDAESDEIVQAAFEDALETGAPWAVEVHERRLGEDR